MVKGATFAVNEALVVPAATATDAGSVTAALLLARLIVCPPVAAAAPKVTVQLSEPAPVIELLLQEIALKGTAMPEPLRLTTAELFVDEVLVMVN